MKVLPNRGHIGIFNRSYYEETLVVRVHPEFLAKQKLPPSLVTKHIWQERFEDIRHFEQYLGAQRGGGAQVLPPRLQEGAEAAVSRTHRAMRRRTGSSQPATPPSGSIGTSYMQAYEEMIQNTATKDAPWYVVPADNKWFTRVVVAAAVIETLASLDLKYPEVGEDKLKELAAARKTLLKE